jgi:hypothetical protein
VSSFIFFFDPNQKWSFHKMKQHFSAKNSAPKTFLCTASAQSSTLTCVEIDKPLSEPHQAKLKVNARNQLQTPQRIANNRRKQCNQDENAVFNEIVTITVDLAQWDPVKLVRVSLNEPFHVKLQVRQQGTLVTISIPAIQFDLSVDAVPVEGFLYTVPGTNLPKELWPAQLLGESFVVSGQYDGLEYGLTIGTDGALTWGSPDSGGISPMPANDGHRLAPTTISYLLPTCTLDPPKNVKFSTGSSSAVGSPPVANFLEYYANDIQQDLKTGKIRAAFIWADNSNGGPLPRNFLNLMVKTAIVNPVTGVATYGPAVQVTNAGPKQFYIEAKVAVNPTNVNNIVAIAVLRDTNFSGFDPRRRRPFVFTSMNGGLSWNSGVEPFATTDERADQWITFDTFGNCFASVNTIPNAPSGPGFLEIQASIDGGLTFPSPTPLLYLQTSGGGGDFLDFPKMSVGPDGTGSGNLALWFSADDALFSLGTTKPTIGFIPVLGLGSYGTPVVVNSFTNIPQGAVQIGLSEILVNPKTGAVYFFSSNINDVSGAFNTLSDGRLQSMWVNPSGTVNFDADSFLPRRDIMIGNMNDNVGGGGYTLPWQPDRGVNAYGISISGYDSKRNRLYFISADMRPNLSNKNVIVIAYSENEGQSWSNQYIVNQNQSVSVGIETIAVESNTGSVAVGFYSPQNDPVLQQSVDYYGFIINAPNIEDC